METQVQTAPPVHLEERVPKENQEGREKTESQEREDCQESKVQEGLSDHPVFLDSPEPPASKARKEIPALGDQEETEVTLD